MAGARNSIVPSWRTGFARTAAQSAAPEQWEGLVGAWAPFLGAQGGRLFDLSGYGTHGTLSGFVLDTAWTTHLRGVGLTFDAVDSYVDLGVAPVLRIGLPATISLWHRAPAAGVETHLFYTDRGGASTNHSGLGLQLNSTNTVSIIYGDNTGSTSTDRRTKNGVTVLTAGVWYHLVAIFRPTLGDMTIMINGVDDGGTGSGSGGAPAYSAAQTSVIGRRAGSYALGFIDDIRLYNRDLSLSDARDLYTDCYGLYRRRPLAWQIPWVLTTPQFAAPAADLTVDNWEEDDGTTTDLFDQIDEVDAEDADYIRTQLTPTNDVYVAGLSSVSDPVSSSGHTLRIRYGKSNSGERIDLVAETHEGYTNEGSQGTLLNTKTFTDIPTGWTTDADAWTEGEADAITTYGNLSQRLVANAVATIAFDAFSNPTPGTGELSWTHTPVGVPQGVLVLIIQEVTAADQVSGVTYGGVAMGEVALSPHLVTAGAEDGAMYGYFLGSSIPTGPQTVVVSVSGAAEKHAVCYTVTAAGATEVDDTSVLDSAGVADPAVTVQTTAGRTTFIAAALYSGQNAPTSVAPGSGYTEVLEYDFQNQNGNWVRRTANGTGSDITVSWTATTEEAGAFAVAIREVAARAQVSWLQFQIPEAPVSAPAPNVEDTITVADTATVLLPVLLINETETITASETSTLLISMRIAEVEAVSLADVSTVQAFLLLQVLDLTTLSELVTPSLWVHPEAVDLSTVADTATVSLLLQPILDETVTAAETATVHLLLQPQLTDAVSVAEVDTVLVLLMPSVADMASVVDLATVELTGAPDVTLLVDRDELITVADLTTVMVVLMPQVTEAVTLSELVTAFASAFTSVEDTLTVAEVDTVRVQLMPVETEDVLLTDEEFFFWPTWVLSISETITAQDILLAGLPPPSSLWPTATVVLEVLSGATVTAPGLIPAGCYVVGVTATVTDTITGASSFAVGTAAVVDLWGDNIATGIGTSTDLINMRPMAIPLYQESTDVILTANGGDFTGGDVSLTVYYFTLTEGIRTLPWPQVSVTLSGLSGGLPIVSSLLVPVGSYAIGVTAEVLSTITGVTTFAIDDTHGTFPWGTGISPLVGTTTDLSDINFTTMPLYAAGQDVTIVPQLGSFTGGSVRLTCTYATLAEPWLTRTMDVSLTGASVTVPMVSQDAWLIGVKTEVLDPVTGVSTFAVGDGDTPTRWGLGLPGTVGAISNLTDALASTGPLVTPGVDVLLTAEGGTFTGGTLRVTAFYMLLTETIVPALLIAPTETVSVADASTLTLTHARSVTEVVSVADVATLIFKIQPKPIEVVTVAEVVTLSMALRGVAIDVITVADVVTANVIASGQVIDLITAAEVVTVHVRLLPLVTEVITVQDEVTPNVLLMPSVVDEVSLADVVSLNLLLMPVVLDLITVADDVTTTMHLPLSVADTITVSEDIDLAGLEAGNFIDLIQTDLITVADVATLTMTLSVTIVEAVSITDEATVAIPAQPRVEDLMTVAETATINMVLMPQVIEAVVSVADLTTVSVSMTLTGDEFVQVQEVFTALMSMRVSVDETVQLTDAGSQQLPIQVPTVVVLVTASETVTVNVHLMPQVVDVVSLSESHTFAYSTVRIEVVDLVGVGETATVQEVPSAFDVFGMVFQTFAGRLV